MHKMFKVETDKNTYCIKVLNPEVMKRDTAYNNFVVSETISNLAKDNNIPVSNALNINNNLFPCLTTHSFKNEWSFPNFCDDKYNIKSNLHIIIYIVCIITYNCLVLNSKRQLSFMRTASSFISIFSYIIFLKIHLIMWFLLHILIQLFLMFCN